MFGQYNWPNVDTAMLVGIAYQTGKSNWPNAHMLTYQMGKNANWLTVRTVSLVSITDQTGKHNFAVFGQYDWPNVEVSKSVS